MDLMSFDEFKEELLKHMNQHHPSVEWGCQDVLKNNGVELTGLIGRREGTNISPTLYINEYYERYQHGMTFQSTTNIIERKYYELLNNPAMKMNIEGMMDFESAKDNIVIRIINRERNEELLSKIPHKIIAGDLAITYRFVAQQDAEGLASALINNKMLDMWKVNQEELDAAALQNTVHSLPIKIRPLQDTILDCMARNISFLPDEEYEEQMKMFKEELSNMPDMGMYVATNSCELNGAAVMLYPQFKQWLEDTFDEAVILPSSVHEVIVVDTSKGHDLDYLMQMVKEANQTAVTDEDYLSDSIYKMEGRELVNINQYDKEIDQVIDNLMEEPPEPDMGPEMI